VIAAQEADMTITTFERPGEAAPAPTGPELDGLDCAPRKIFAGP
jgi:hypothetical protein